VKRALGIVILVFAVPLLQGALVPFLPPAVRPDLALLVVFALTLSWRNTATGLVLAAICGYVVDLFSGGLLGQHALMSVLVFAASRVLSVRVSMIGAIPQMIFAGALTAAHAFGMAALTTFFTPGAGFGLLRLGTLVPHIAANAILAPLVASLVSVVVSWVGGEQDGRRPLRLATRSFAG
jgi:rod shape-determining protein MreD